MPILITAFGPFGGREKNASSLVLDALRKQFPRIRTRLLPVDSGIAPSRLKQAIRLIRPSAIIMLGEAGGSAEIRLETTAWNLLDFRIPDIAGKQPVGRLISRGGPASLPTTLPLDEIYARLDAVGFSVTRSDDPGRYLCNQVMFHTLHDLRNLGWDIPAGFIHLPLEDQLPTADAVRALSEIIRMIASSLTEKTMEPPLHSTIYESPIGPITLVSNGKDLCGLYNHGQKHWPKDSVTWISDDWTVFDSARKWLEGYFSGKKTGPLPKIDFENGTDFQKKVWNELLAIPAGKTVSYGELAKKVGAPNAVRAVGAAVGRNPVSIIVPCHRVVGGNGSLTGYAGGLDKKRWLLMHEGAET